MLLDKEAIKRVEASAIVVYCDGDLGYEDGYIITHLDNHDTFITNSQLKELGYEVSEDK